MQQPGQINSLFRVIFICTIFAMHLVNYMQMMII